MGFDRHGRRFPAGLEMAEGNGQRHDSILEVHLPFFAVLEDSRMVWIGQRGNADKMSRLRANGIARLGRTNFENFAVISKTDIRGSGYLGCCRRQRFARSFLRLWIIRVKARGCG